MSERRQVVGWPEYEVDDMGNVFRIAPSCGAKVGRQLKPIKMSHGYLKVGLSRASVVTDKTVHRIVAEAFLGPIPEGMDVCHIDGTRDNNAVSNLRIDTRSGNMADSARHGTLSRGERHPYAKYTAEQVLSIRRRLDSGEKVAALSNELGIPKPTLWGIKNRANWGHL